MPPRTPFLRHAHDSLGLDARANLMLGNGRGECDFGEIETWMSLNYIPQANAEQRCANELRRIATNVVKNHLKGVSLRGL